MCACGSVHACQIQKRIPDALELVVDGGMLPSVAAASELRSSAGAAGALNC